MTERTNEAAGQLTENDYTLTMRPGETQTAFAIRYIKAEAWDEGATKASPHGGACLRSLLIENPYRDFATAPAPASDDLGRCQFRNAHYLTNRADKRDDGWRCGKEAGHVNGHYLYSADGETVLDTMGPWVLPEEQRVVTSPEQPAHPNPAPPTGDGEREGVGA